MRAEMTRAVKKDSTIVKVRRLRSPERDVKDAVGIFAVESVPACTIEVDEPCGTAKASFCYFAPNCIIVCSIDGHRIELPHDGVWPIAHGLIAFHEWRAKVRYYRPGGAKQEEE